VNKPADETAQGEASSSHESPPQDELAALLEELRAIEQKMPPAVRGMFEDLLNPEKLSHASGVEPPERVRALLSGAIAEDGPQESAETRRLNRLVFLRNTRLKHPTSPRPSRRVPRPYFFSEIARGVQARGGKLSKQTVHYIFNEGRQPSPENLAHMERFFGVLPGFCSYTDREALAVCLRPIVQQLSYLLRAAEAAARGITKIAARTSEDLSPGTDPMTAILTAILSSEAPEEPS
jgi:hypothetical protein